MFAAARRRLKNVGRMEDEETTNGTDQLCGLMALHRPRPALTRGPQCTFVHCSTVPTTHRPFPVLVFFPFSIRAITRAYIADKSIVGLPPTFEPNKKEIPISASAATTRARTKAREVTIYKYCIIFVVLSGFFFKFDDRVDFIFQYHV